MHTRSSARTVCAGKHAGVIASGYRLLPATRLFLKNDDPRLVLREQHGGQPHQRAHARDPEQPAHPAVQVAPVQRDVEVGGARHHVELAETHPLGGANDLGGMHVALGHAELGNDGRRTALVPPARLGRHDDPARLERAIGAGERADFIDGMVQAVEEHDDIEFFLEVQGLVVPDDEVQVVEPVLLLQAARSVDCFRHQVLADHIVTPLGEQHTGPAGAASHVQQAPVFRHHAHHRTKLHQVQAALPVGPGLVRGMVHAAFTDVLEVVVFALGCHRVF